MKTNEYGQELSDDGTPKAIIWLASFPKSGNTWVRAFLSALIEDREIDINRLKGVVDDVDARLYQASAVLPLQELSQFEMIALRLSALSNAIRLYGPGRHALLVKSHSANATGDGIPFIPPRMTKGAIYIHRDPRDIALSWQRHAKGKSIEEAVDDICNPNFILKRVDGPFVWVSDWGNHARSWLEKKNDFPVLVIAYQEMIRQPDIAFSKIATFVGLRSDSETTSRAIERSSFEVLQWQEAHFGFRERNGDAAFFHNGGIGIPEYWEEEGLTPALQKRIEEACKEAMVKLGYTLTF